MAPFYLCPKNFSEAKFKGSRLIPLVDEVSGQPHVDCIIWLLVITVVWIYNEKEQVEQEEMQKVQFEETKTIQKLKVVSKACTERDTEIQRPCLHWIKEKGALRIRPYPAKLPPFKRKGRRNFPLLKRNRK